MPRKFYTILILPHAQARFKRLYLSRNFLATASSVLLVGLVAAASVPHLLLKVRAQSDTLSLLRDENRKLRQEKQRFETSLSQLGEKLNAFEAHARKLAAGLGLRDLAASALAAGGAPPGLPGGSTIQGMLDEELEALRTRADHLDLSFQRLDDAWQERAKLLAHTPNLMPVRGFFSDLYGWRKDPFTGEREFHKGVDIVVPAGTVIRAPADGLVTRTGRMGGYGKMVHLSHGYGLGTRYGHLSEILVRPGQKVARGDVVGRVGSTGRSSGPHLHYEVYKGGRQVNPRKYLAAQSF